MLLNSTLVANAAFIPTLGGIMSVTSLNTEESIAASVMPALMAFFAGIIKEKGILSKKPSEEKTSKHKNY